MSGASNTNESIAAQTEHSNDSGECLRSALQGPSQDHDDSPGGKSVAPVAENSGPSVNVAATPLDKESEQPAATKGRQSDDTIELLVSRFRDFLEAEAAPNPPTSGHTNTKRTTGRGRLFGLSKGLPPETNGLSNRFDYEQKYPRDRLGEECAPNARVWLTYLDEAEVHDREKVEGWKETVDVLLVFAGLFSGVITAFISQVSPSLQQDNGKVSASLLFETTQLLRAGFNGTSVNNIPASTLNPTSPFQPSTNAFLVNGLLFASLAITLSTALFAVLAKQWLYYYLSSFPGTAHDKVRARQLRFKGFEMWKVGAIVDLLPILLHLAVGVFLTGIIILLFPLDNRVAWTIVAIAGTTYILYFISVILPIRYPGCPYTTSLTIYVGILFYLFRRIFHLIGANLKKTIHRKKHLPKVTNWREENIKNAINDAAYLDHEALGWLHNTSSDTSVHRIIARCVSVHPILTQEFASVHLENRFEVNLFSGTNLSDLHYALCLDIPHGLFAQFWRTLSLKSYEEGSEVEEAGYKSYSRIAKNVLRGDYDQILNDALLDETLQLPPFMWYHFLANTDGDATAIAVIFIEWNPFKGRPIFPQPTCNTGLVSFRAVLSVDGVPKQWIFNYLFRYFCDSARPDYSSDDKSFETRYLLLVSVYRNLTSDAPLIAHEGRRQDSLFWLFHNFWDWLCSSEPQSLSPKQYLAFFRDILGKDAFWSESMTEGVRRRAVLSLHRIWDLMDTDVSNLLPFMERDDFSLIYQWCSRDLDNGFSWFTAPIFTLLFMPQNCDRLCMILSNDPAASVSSLPNCLRHINISYHILFFRRKIYPSLMDLFKSVNRNVPGPLFMVLYDSLVLVQAWRFLVKNKLNEKEFFRIVVSKLDPKRLNNLFSLMNQEVQSVDFEDLEDYEHISDRDAFRDALRESACEFGQLIRVPPSELESTTGSHAHEGGTERDYDSEELAQEPDGNEHEGSRSIFYRTAARFKSIWRKESVNETNNVELSEIRTE